MTFHGGNIYDFPKRENLTDFSSNINPFGPPGFAMSAARDALRFVARYPDSAQTEIRRAFSEWLGVPDDSLVFGNGASELIAAILSAERPRRVIVTRPTFAEYEACASRLGIKSIAVPSFAEDDFAFDVRGIEKIFSEGDMLFLCQPNNPTGAPWSAEALGAMADLCASRGGKMTIDECFINLADPPLASCLGKIARRGVIVLRAVTKDFSAPGLRIGFAAAHPETIRGIKRHIQPWPLNCAGEAFAIACARKPEPFLSESARKIARLRENLFNGLSALGFEPNPGAVNYLLVRSPKPDAEFLYEALAERSVLIRKCSGFPGLDDKYFRVAVSKRNNNEKLLRELASVTNR
jgi:threonine-phosphate decarboxylase